MTGYSKYVENTLYSIFVTDRQPYAQRLSQGLNALRFIQDNVTYPLNSYASNPLHSFEYKKGAIEKIRINMLSMFVELGELINTMEWKPWKKGHITDTQRVEEELADVLAFLGNILSAIQAAYPTISINTIVTQYLKTCENNIKRFQGQVDQYGIED